jgi:hypothetical protein
MTLLRKLLAFSTLLILFFSCQKELSLENGGETGGEFQWEFKEAALEFKGPIDTAYIDASAGLEALSIEGVSSDGTGSIILQVFGNPLSATTYKTPNVVFEYASNGTVEYLNDLSATDKFSVTISSIDSVSVSGTFSGEVEDKQGNVKTISEGKFTAKFKKTTTPPPAPTNCKISNIGYFEIGGGGYASLTSTFNASNVVNKVQLIDSSNSNAVLIGFNLTYATNRVNIDNQQYFITDANGRISEFHGYFDADPTVIPLKMIIRYSFDANGYMQKAAYWSDTIPSQQIFEINYTWTSGNLTKAVISSAGVSDKIEYTYQYDANKTVKNFLAFFPALEILYNQSAINFGKNSANAVIKSTIVSTQGGTTITENSDYIDYVIDANNYVKSFILTGNGSIYYPDTKYVLTYKCF